MRTAVLALAIGLGVVMAAGQSIQTLKLDAVQPLYLVSADLNRDGFPDLAVACHSSNSVVIFENTRLPCTSFKEKVQWVLEDSPVALAVGYFMDPVCSPMAPTCFPYTSVFPNLVAVTQYQPGVVRFTPVEAKAPFLKLVPGGPIKVNVLPYTTLTHLVLADFNNDGAMDIAVLDGVSMKIGIYPGDRVSLRPAAPPQGSISGAPGFLVELKGEETNFLGASDFDRDGLVDLAVAVDGYIRFFRNESTPNELKFTLVGEVKLGKKIKSFAIADFNRDGYPDLAVVDPEFSALTIVFNRGCWKFERGQRLKFDAGPVFVVAADFDRNGLPDLAVAEKDGNRVSIVINELAELGKISRPDPCTNTVNPPELVDVQSFRILKVIEVGRTPLALAADDFDLNGIMDLAVALYGDNAVQVIYNPLLCPDCSGNIPCTKPTGAGMLEPEPEKAGEPQKLEATPPVPEPSSAVVSKETSSFDLALAGAEVLTLGDLNADGKADLVVADQKKFLYLYQGVGDGSFVAKGDVFVGFKVDKVLVADFDGNGLSDILAVNWQTRDAVICYLKGPFSIGKSSFFSIPLKAKDVWAFQLNDSKGLEIVWLTGEKPLVWSVSPQGSFVELAQIPPSLASLTPLASPVQVYAALGPDIALVHYSSNPGEIFVSLGTKNVAEIRVGEGTPLKAVAVGDIDGNGTLDVVTMEDGGRLRTWLMGSP
jgi:hypothetical protein